VCRRGQKVVAIRRARLFKKHAEITDNCVQESFRGEGLSSLMLSHAKEYISRSYPNIRYFVLYIKKSNPLFGMLKAYHERNRAVVIRETDKYVVLRYDA
jgi:ribosomal protein S18 acetylase RimI-like enzyme